jgi:hypothetical protein
VTARLPATVLGAVMILAMTACGHGAVTGEGSVGGATTVVSGGGGSTPQVVTVVPDKGEPSDWGATSFDGMSRVATNAPPTAATLPFAAVVPASAGTPAAVYISHPQHTASGWSIVTLTYNSSSPYGVFRVIEEKYPPGTVEPSYAQQIAAACTACSSALLVSIGSDQAAVLVTPDVSGVAFLDGGTFEVKVMGPPATFSPAAAIRVATQIAQGLTTASPTAP